MKLDLPAFKRIIDQTPVHQLVGRVSRVGPSSSKVLLITDTSSSISGRVQSSDSRLTGIIKGRPEGGLIMRRIPQEESLQTGETVVTSNFGGLLPEGLVVGQIVQIRRKDVDVMQEAIIEPSADMKRLERLYVLLSTADARPSTEIVPLSGKMIDMIIRIVVVFPAPLGPMNPTSSPGAIARSNASTV